MSKTSPRSTTRRGKEWCAASGRARTTRSAARTPRRCESSTAGPCVQHRVRLRYDQHARRLFGGRDKTKTPEHLQGDYGPPTSGGLKGTSDKEIANLAKHGVYQLVPITAVVAGQTVVSTWWVIRIKADGTNGRCLVVQGWSQVPEIDCGDTFTPVCRLQSIRVMLVTAAELE